MTKKIKVNLITNYSGDAQHSMLSYASQIEEGLRLHFADRCQADTFTPAETRFGKLLRRNPIGKKIDSYWNRFVKHPIIANRACDGINHIVDHHNSYLIRYLDAGQTIVTCHDMVHFKMPNRKNNSKLFLSRSAIRKYEVSGLKRAVRIIADSENTKKDIVELFKMPPEKITVVYPGIRPCFREIRDADILSKTRKRLNFNWDKTMLHVGENSYYKNINAVLHALKILRKKSQADVHFVKAGKDFNSEQNDLISKLGIRDYVHYLGDLSDSELNLVYNLSDALVFPSLYEGFGWPPLEAMACGTPVVSSDKGSLKEVLGDSAIFIEPHDTEGIAEATSLLMSDAGIRQEKVRQGFDNAKRFNWKKMSGAILQIYKEVGRETGY